MPVPESNDDVVLELRSRLEGSVIGPDDAGYEDARTVFYGGIDGRPVAVARVTGAQDVSEVVTFARRSGLELAVRGGGHSLAGHSTSEGGIVLDLSGLRGMDIDPSGHVAWAGAGLTAAEYTTAAGQHGLATGFGDTGSVGIGGLTLGGGVGFLVRRFGLTIDDLLAAEVVTAGGEVRHVDAEEHPDLFWAIRGGGGNFGVATRFRFRLHELPEVVGGMLILPASARVIASFMEAAEAAPEELTAIANVMTAPPMPFLPPEAHGKTVLFALMCFAGSAEGGERAYAPFRALATPLVDMIRPMPYPELYAPDDEDYHPLAASHTMFLDAAGLPVAETVLDRLQRSTAMMAVVQLRALGGAMARVPREATAFAHRRSRIMANVGAVYEHPADAAEHTAWVDESTEALRQGDDGAYVNFLHDEGPERVRAAFPGSTWERLVQVKDRYDPTNLFRLNQNIPPSGR